MRSIPRLPFPMALAALLGLIPALAWPAAGPTFPTFQMKWGTLGTAPAQFNFPEGLAVDALGNVYVLDSGNNRIQKFGVLGNFILQWGSGGTGNGQLDQHARSADGHAFPLAGNAP